MASRPLEVPFLDSILWIVEKQEEWTGKICVYRLFLRAFPLVGTAGGPWKIDATPRQEQDPRLGSIVLPVIKKTFDQASVGQMVRMKLAFGQQRMPQTAQIEVPRKTRRGKTPPVKGIRSLSRGQQKTGFAL